MTPTPPADLARRFQARFGRSPALFARAPGRVNLLGGHVDYNEGWVLPAAIDRAAWVAATPRTDRTARIVALDLGAEVTFHLDGLGACIDAEGRPLPAWARYPAGVAWALERDGFDLVGMEAALASEVPIGAGLSSSAAVEVAFGLAWTALAGVRIGHMRLAQVCQRAENGYVGVPCGLMDQFASVHGRRDHALLFDCRTLDWEPIPLPADVRLVVADSGVPRTLAGSGYQERREACQEAVRLLSRRLPGIRALRDVSPEDLARHGDVLPVTLRRRAEHVVRECARVLEGAGRLKAGDLAGFGALMFESHASLRDLYEVSTPELDALVEIAAGLPGCLGARLTGAGFGGATVNLVRAEEAEAFVNGLTEAYRARTGREAAVWVCRAETGGSVHRPPN